MSFKNAKEMMEKLETMDLYNPQEELYAFLYNDNGAIAVYPISNDEAVKLQLQSKELTGDYWGASLGHGGTVIDDGMEFCEDNYSKEGWIDTNDVKTDIPEVVRINDKVYFLESTPEKAGDGTFIHPCTESYTFLSKYGWREMKNIELKIKLASILKEKMAS